MESKMSSAKNTELEKKSGNQERLGVYPVGKDFAEAGLFGVSCSAIRMKTLHFQK
jgi:hypothetical protein